MEVLFWLCVAVVVHTYVGHPAVLYGLARWRPKPWRRAANSATVAVVVCAFNEERDLAKKIENLLAQDFGDFQVVIANDGSTDGTATIARSFEDAHDRVRLFDFAENRGKSAMLNEIIPQLGTDLVVFSDATCLWPPDTLRRLQEQFADDDVGCVGANIFFVERNAGAVESGQRSYWKYETFLRRQGALAGTNVVVSGTCYAMRRDLFATLPEEIAEDLANPVRVAFSGKRVVFDPQVKVEEYANVRHDSEVRMRQRVAIQNIAALFAYGRLINPKYGFAAYQLFAHKYLRGFCWVAMVAAFLLNVGLARSGIYGPLLWAQAGFYLLGLVGLIYHRRQQGGKLLYVPYYFLVMNLSYAVALAQYFAGQRKATWETER